MKCHRNAVRTIDQESFGKPWDETCWKLAMSEKGMRGRVAIVGDVIAGFIIFNVTPTRIEIVRLGVNNKMRRRSIGSTLLGAALVNLASNRQEIIAPVLDCDHEAQEFFRAQGFKARGVVRKYAQSNHDCFVLSYRMEVRASQ